MDLLEFYDGSNMSDVTLTLHPKFLFHSQLQELTRVEMLFGNKNWSKWKYGSTKFLTVTQIVTVLLTARLWIHSDNNTKDSFAARVRGMHGVSKASAAGAMIIRNGSQSGDKRLELDAPAAAGMIDPYIPDEGIRYPDGAFIDISGGFDSVTVFFDGSY